MSAIHILSDRVANQIAAGEVIERPVAVVKELVENSIDAGATKIDVVFKHGGKAYIRVEDDGRGMAPDEALLSLERHATSKIRESGDLAGVRSFGFRGEALPSIASVSKFTLRTRAEDCLNGTEIRINGGKLIDKRDCGMPVGTVVEVAHLFHAVPARRKFLKTDATETAHITYTLRLFAVAHPSVAFRVKDDRRVVFQSPACDGLRERIREIWGRRMAEDLVPIDACDDNCALRLSGLTAKPGIGRSTRRELITLVNKRPVDSRTLGFAVLDAYHGRIQKGRFPPAFLFLDIPPEAVDVNVHPAKREIRFRNDGAVRRFVLQSITETVSTASRITPPEPAENECDGGKPSPSPPPVPQPAAIHTLGPERPPSPRASHPAPSRPEERAGSPTIGSERSLKSSAPDVRASSEPAAEPERSLLADWRLLAILRRQFALYQSPAGLVLVHLRHASQRVRFERILRRFEAHEPESQPLLIPESLELEPLASEALKRHAALLNRHGFGIEEFGRNFFRLEAIPAWLSPDESVAFLRDLIDRLRQRDNTSIQAETTWELVARLAAEGSYRRDDATNEESVNAMLDALMRCEIPHTSPFGKPTFSEISWQEWERRLGLA